MLKKTLILLVLSILLVGFNFTNSEARGEGNMENEKESYSHRDNLVVNRGKDFHHGEYKGLILDEKSKIKLADGKKEGTYTSPIIPTENFNELVASWNASTPEKTNIEVFVQAEVEGQWTRWYSYGKWSSNKNSGSVRKQSDKLAKLSIDTLEVLGEGYADAIRYKLVLKRQDIALESPRVKAVYMALKTENQEGPALAEDINYLVELDVPERSQMIIPKIGRRICSPTSVSMVLEYYGHNMKTEEVAARVLDREVDIYGNWSYNASFAGLEGLNSHVARFNSVDRIREKISEGIPVIASIKTRSKDTLLGAPQTYPSGHLIVIRGFLEKDGKEYIVVNDPASPRLENVRREYEVSGFEKAWSNIVYIISEDKE